VKPAVAIIGAGMMGLSAGYRLARAGVHVDVYERSPDPGGLAGSIRLGGERCDRFYHVTLPTDDRVLDLAGELGLGDRFRFEATRTAFYDDGRLLPLSTTAEFLRFDLLPLHDRLRLAAFVASCQLKKTHDDLDETPLLEWLERRCGRRTCDRLWRPLLDAKFDGRFDDLPATYLWARTRRMSGARGGARSRETMGSLRGGYQAMIDRLVAAIRDTGGTVQTGIGVREIMAGGGAVNGVLLADGLRRYDAVLCTLLPAQAADLLPGHLSSALPLGRHRYLGVICTVVKLRRRLSPFYTVNITDRRIPLTGLIETTNVIDPAEVGGHLVYLPRYADPDSPEFAEDDDTIGQRHLASLETMFGPVAPGDLLDMTVQRARLAEPVHVLGSAGLPFDAFPLPGLALASTAQIYPELVNSQAVLGISQPVADELLSRLSDPAARAA
jgi:protoporphyrinogen oxidase